eukprot:CAMPEP_0194668128 /NCGR_PEP_ID=MMETSP0295-20121207/3736_1 /TAXON_ID=39354 /ORGANISM="Heterosigma akashiwo, Strain CCMP2393" /LENGTH=121 /DNA_ID=CAMNT_0039550729 /DNA_START=194 /DNA_END=556 /DNA_ORIENTATION=-
MRFPLGQAQGGAVVQRLHGRRVVPRRPAVVPQRLVRAAQQVRHQPAAEAEVPQVLPAHQRCCRVRALHCFYPVCQLLELLLQLRLGVVLLFVVVRAVVPVLSGGHEGQAQEPAGRPGPRRP